MSIKLFEKMSHNDPNVWALFAEGKTKGIFQLESNLGKNWSKKLQPVNMEQLSALVAILRPGALKGMLEDKSITQHYVDRIHNREFVTYIHDSCKDILETTLGLMLYQEQTMQISTRVAGFSGIEADKLRTAIGKKKADLMQQLKSKFIKGCEKLGVVDKKKAEEIFDIIEKSARYQFNKCLDPNTIIETETGEMKTLEKIQIGEKILCPTKNGDEFIEVLDFMESGEKELYEVELDDGKTITCSIDHEFLCEDGEKYPLYYIIDKNLRIMCID
jgi:DNA polymerase-3 subunit alpha